VPEEVLRAVAGRFSGAAADRVRAALQALVGHVGELERVCWCVLFLGEGDVTRVEQHARAAIADHRDVLWWAEYDGGETRLRDLSRGLPEDVQARALRSRGGLR